MASGVRLRQRTALENVSRRQSMRRVVIKQGYLKKLPNASKIGAGLKKPDRRWFVFGVVNGCDPYLEYYENEDQLFMNNPINMFVLDKCYNIIRDDKNSRYVNVFTLVLKDRHLSLVSHTRMEMLEWCRAVENKLHELGIYNPGGSNDYDQLPWLRPLSERPARPPTPPDNLADDNDENVNPTLETVGNRASTMAVSQQNNTNSELDTSTQNSGTYGALWNSRTDHEIVNGDVYALSTRSSRHSQNLETASLARPRPNAQTSPQLLDLNRTESMDTNSPPPVLPPRLSRAVSQPNHLQNTNSDFFFGDHSQVLRSQNVRSTQNVTSGQNVTSSQNVRSSMNVSTPMTPGNAAFQISLPDTPLPPYSPANPLGSPVLAAEAPSYPDMPTSNTGDPAVISDKMREAYGLGNPEITGWSMPPSSTEGAPPPYVARSVLQRGANQSLKQSQVETLKKEMSNPGGVRVVLQKRDCYQTVALVDCFNKTWVAGWNQAMRPFLLSAFHIGDQLVSVNGQVIENAKMAYKLIKSCTSRDQLTFIIRRLPVAKVFGIRRAEQGQNLGIERDGGTAVITKVNQNGLASENGLPAKATTWTGDNLCNWCLTEINHRPLNLFYKDNEIEHRLNAVGKDISFVVQPIDFIDQLKKNLKSTKNYKDFLLI